MLWSEHIYIGGIAFGQKFKQFLNSSAALSSFDCSPTGFGGTVVSPGRALVCFQLYLLS